MRVKKIFLLLSFIFAQFAFASYDDSLFGGIEIGSKGIKISVLDVDNIKKGNYEIKSFWTENVGIARGIAIDGKLAPEDIKIATEVVYRNYLRIKNEFKVTEQNIFIVGSSGVAMASNTKELVDAVKKLTNKELDFIDAQAEGKMLLKGCIPPVNYLNSTVLDIGGGNTKGGYVDTFNNDNFVFFPLSFDYGSITLTETVKKKTKTESIGEYNEKLFGVTPMLREQIKAMYNSKPQALEKQNVYMSGGAVWAFYTLYNGGEAKDNFNSFTLEDVINYDAVVKNNFQKFEELAKKNKEVERVLKTYSQKHLISGSALLLVCLEDIPGINDKKLFFAKQGQTAWLVSYIVDRSNKIKKIW
ncbi:exopolyphosphatase [Flavobacterium columnare]|uniref:Exopolyphosphatase n=2 Tax=Flavobacterium columnare TaxID=996 RepID=G8X567_FLACA|nr:exopolyphosphatase [Flavobacterium columnare]AEW85478.1 exopolyphosphatase [Flavobacterium columnare ATCC 49512]AMO20121.1 exopolyphosphatase [Flavobacterium columnare]ANO49326.1 exopolyphosphatase [Flavobacterium columnare]APT22696.1 exopolyphosphatase [Flavobacterium columnare]AUX18071.1 exopolyphosphatase [Flavobacterium columnare]